MIRSEQRLFQPSTSTRHWCCLLTRLKHSRRKLSSCSLRSMGAMDCLIPGKCVVVILMVARYDRMTLSHFAFWWIPVLFVAHPFLREFKLMLTGLKSKVFQWWCRLADSRRRGEGAGKQRGLRREQPSFASKRKRRSSRSGGADRPSCPRCR